MKKPQTRIIRTEFFEDEVTNWTGPISTPEELDTFMGGDSIYDEAANMRIIERNQKRAKAETLYVEDAKNVLREANTLLMFMREGNLHGAVYAAMLLEEQYVRLILRRREKHAWRGRRHGTGSHKGAATTNASRKQQPNPLVAQVKADWKLYLQTTDKRDIANKLAKKYHVTKGHIRRLKNNPGK